MARRARTKDVAPATTTPPRSALGLEPSGPAAPSNRMDTSKKRDHSPRAGEAAAPTSARPSPPTITTMTPTRTAVSRTLAWRASHTSSHPAHALPIRTFHAQNKRSVTRPRARPGDTHVYGAPPRHRSKPRLRSRSAAMLPVRPFLGQRSGSPAAGPDAFNPRHGAPGPCGDVVLHAESGPRHPRPEGMMRYIFRLQVRDDGTASMHGLLFRATLRARALSCLQVRHSP